MTVEGKGFGEEEIKERSVWWTLEAQRVINRALKEKASVGKEPGVVESSTFAKIYSQLQEIRHSILAEGTKVRDKKISESIPKQSEREVKEKVVEKVVEKVAEKVEMNR